MFRGDSPKKKGRLGVWPQTALVFLWLHSQTVIGRPTVARFQLSGSILCDRRSVAQGVLETLPKKVTHVDI